MAVQELVGENLIKKHEIMPFGMDGINTLKVAMSDPMNLAIIDDIEMATGMEVAAMYAPQTSINLILDKIYGKKATMEAAQQFEEEHAAEYADEEQEDEDTVGDAPIVKIVRSMLNWHTLGRIAIEADVQRKEGRKVRLYSYDGCGVTGLMCRGVSIRQNGELSTDKKYYGVYGDVDAVRNDIEGMVSPSFLARVCSNDELFRSHNMSFRYMASEVSDYGVDAKFYFRNEGERRFHARRTYLCGVCRVNVKSRGMMKETSNEVER